MKITKNRTMATLTALFLALTITVTLVALPIANAHTPPWTIPTYSYIAVAPDPVGVGQSVFLIVWVHGAPITAAGIGGDRYIGFTIKVTKPNGDTETLGPWVSDPTGSYYTQYTPDQVGTYKFNFSWPGMVVTGKHPVTGTPSTSNLAYVNDTYLGSSATATLTVQQEQIAKIPEYPLPTEYWARPIEEQNTAWASITSHWLRGGHLGYPNLWQKDGVAPNSPHIMWTKPIEFGGVVGGTTAIPGVGFYSGGSYEGRFVNAIIMAGRLYYPVPLGHSGSGGGYACVDLRTGEELWYRGDIGVTGAAAPSFGQLFNYESMNQHGVVGGILWQTSTVAGVTTWQAIDPFTGKWLYNLTSVPSGTDVYTDKGEIVRYVFNYPGRWLALWNSTQDNMGLHGAIGTTSSAYQWRPNTKTVNMSTAYSWNVTIPDLPGLSSPAIVKVIPGDVILGTSTALITTGVGQKWTADPYTLWAISDKPASRGQLLWIKNYTAPAGNLTRRLGIDPVDPVNRVFLMYDIETMEWLGYSLDNGNLLWGPVTGAERVFTYYGSGLGGHQQGFIAYGNLYTQGFGGELICYSTKNGTVLWKYNNTNSGFETPWGNYPIFIGAIADGKVYAFNNEHSPNYPLYKGERVRCINATTGEEIWTLLGWAGQTGGPGAPTPVLAEGFLVYYNYYDNQIYCLGKGPSATTVSAPQTGIPQGQSVMITGTVIDTAAGTRQREQAARFPNGVPAVSDESMGEWMEYVYMQKPCPADVKGVEVTLDVIDSNGNYRNIGTATSDASGFFSYVWTPDIPGKYTVIATFAGSESYWPSYAKTAIYVEEAPPATPPPAQPPAAPDNTLTIVGTGVAIIIAVAIVGLLILRKKP